MYAKLFLFRQRNIVIKENPIKSSVVNIRINAMKLYSALKKVADSAIWFK